MFKWTPFPFIRISLCLSLGVILYGHYAWMWEELSFMEMALPSAIVIGIAFTARYPVLRGAACLALFVFMGGVLALLSDQSRIPGHYTSFETVDGFVGLVVSDNTERDRYQRYEVEVKQVARGAQANPTTGKIYLYIKKEGVGDSTFRYGDVLLVDKGYFDIAPPKNPHEFNYREYLKRQHIHAHAFVGMENVRHIGYEPANLLLATALQIRAYAKERIDDYIPQERERAILTALLLGIKDYLDTDIKSAYAAAGAMHVLAVSGLHVGIVYVILGLLFQKWKETKYGKRIFAVGAIAVIWLYAMVTGFSPSVMRAATMFSVIIVSGAFGRRANIYNSLGIAAMVLILYDPNIIYAVGFQLSFAAVLGIVILHPMLYRLLFFPGRVMDYLWSITCVSIAAQVATFPLTLLYFHQFPTYFLVSNLIVIPAAVVMLGGGILMLAAGGLLPLIGEGLGYLFQFFVWAVNELISAIKWLPYPIFDWLYFDVLDTVLVYGALLFLVLTFSRYSYPYAVLTCFCAMMLCGWLHWKDYSRSDQQRVIFYEIDGITAIDLIKGDEALLLIDDFSPGQREVVSFQIDPNRLASGLPKTSATWQDIGSSRLVRRHPCFDLIEWEGWRIALMKHTEGYTYTQPVKADVVYFKEKNAIMYENLQPGQVVLGTGFSFYEERRAREEFEKLKIDVHSLARDGFWEVDLKNRNLQSEPRKLTLNQ